MPRILIAEDEPDIRELVRITLEFAGFDVVATHNGQELIDRIRDVDPDLVLTDVRMPRMTGYEACRVIKEDPTLAHIPVVFLSAKGQEEEVEEGLKAGALDYILKPFAPNELTSRLTELLERAQKEVAEKAPKPTEKVTIDAAKPTEVKSTKASEVSTDGKKPDAKSAPAKEKPLDEPKPEDEKASRIAALRKGIARWEKDKKDEPKDDSTSTKKSESQS